MELPMIIPGWWDWAVVRTDWLWLCFSNFSVQDSCRTFHFESDGRRSILVEVGIQFDLAETCIPVASYQYRKFKIFRVTRWYTPPFRIFFELCLYVYNFSGIQLGNVPYDASFHFVPYTALARHGHVRTIQIKRHYYQYDHACENVCVLRIGSDAYPEPAPIAFFVDFRLQQLLGANSEKSFHCL